MLFLGSPTAELSGRIVLSAVSPGPALLSSPSSSVYTHLPSKSAPDQGSVLTEPILCVSSYSSLPELHKVNHTHLEDFPLLDFNYTPWVFLLPGVLPLQYPGCLSNSFELVQLFTDPKWCCSLGKISLYTCSFWDHIHSHSYDLKCHPHTDKLKFTSSIQTSPQALTHTLKCQLEICTQVLNCPPPKLDLCRALHHWLWTGQGSGFDQQYV